MIVSSWWVWGAADVVVSGWCGDHDAMSVVQKPGVDDGDLPSRHLPGVIAAFAGAAAVAKLVGPPSACRML
jgi:hypothetical protein